MRRNYFLPDYLQLKYKELETSIENRLREFAAIPENKYFYELCYCLCTPQTKAKNAALVQNILEEADFYNKPFNPEIILKNPSHYIRFHNQKAQRLMKAREQFDKIMEILCTNDTNEIKRISIVRLVNGFGMKEGSHFLRNIGYKNLAILDRHILKHLQLCGVIYEIKNINSTKKYLEIEHKFGIFAEHIDISVDKLDLLFWSYETGEILK